MVQADGHGMQSVTKLIIKKQGLATHTGRQEKEKKQKGEKTRE